MWAHVFPVPPNQVVWARTCRCTQCATSRALSGKVSGDSTSTSTSTSTFTLKR